MPGSQGYAVVSCHVERPLDDAVWDRYRELVRQPAGRASRSPRCMRAAGRRRGRASASSSGRARRPRSGRSGTTRTGRRRRTRVRPAAIRPSRCCARAAGCASAGLEPRVLLRRRLVHGRGVLGAVAELGYVDCTATAARPSFLPPGSPRAALDAPAWIRLDDGRRVLELPSTHSLGAAARGARAVAAAGRARPLPRLRAARAAGGALALSADAAAARAAPPAGRAGRGRDANARWRGTDVCAD